MGVLTEFKTFLTKTNALALAIGVIIGAAVGKVVSSIVSGMLMPLIGLVIPSGDWRDWAFGANKEFKTGEVLGALLDFVIIASVVFFLTKLLLRERPAPPGPPTTKTCPECCEQVPLAARKCRACTSVLPT